MKLPPFENNWKVRFFSGRSYIFVWSCKTSSCVRLFRKLQQLFLVLTPVKGKSENVCGKNNIQWLKFCFSLCPSSANANSRNIVGIQDAQTRRPLFSDNTKTWYLPPQPALHNKERRNKGKGKQNQAKSSKSVDWAFSASALITNHETVLADCGNTSSLDSLAANSKPGQETDCFWKIYFVPYFGQFQFTKVCMKTISPRSQKWGKLLFEKLTFTKRVS